MNFTRKGQVEVQFNWIFVLIIGAIILGFFVSIAVKQQSVSQTQSGSDFFTALDKELVGASAEAGKTQVVTISNTNLHFDCVPSVDSCSCGFYTGSTRGSSNIYDAGDLLIFSPDYIKGNTILLSSMAWNYPFRISNFLFILSPQEKYLMENDANGIGSMLFNNTPPQTMVVDNKNVKTFDKALFNPADSTTIPPLSGYYKVKFIFTSTDPTTFIIPPDVQKLSPGDVTAIMINGPLDDPNSVVFYEMNPSDTEHFEQVGNSSLVGDATVYAALFSNDLNTYACMMNRAFKDYEVVSKIYAQKQQNYFGLFQGPLAGDPRNSTCLTSYDSTYLVDIYTAAGGFNFFQPEQGMKGRIADDVNTFVHENENAIQEGCPQMY